MCSIRPSRAPPRSARRCTISIPGRCGAGFGQHADASRFISGSLASADDISVFAGANALAVQNADGDWEIVQFANATLTAPGQWTLTRLLRGRRGSEGAMRSPVAAGARVVVLNDSLSQ